MAEQLKNRYNEDFVNNLSMALKKADENFNEANFIATILDENWEARELKDRTNHISKQMHGALPYSYKKQISILSKITAEFNGFTATIFPTFVELFGLSDIDTSIKALELFTQHSTSEFAIRPFLANDPTLIETMYKWSKSDNFHVRRLASEGCRPLLPWAMKLHHLVEDPSPILPIIDTLKNDPEDYVYRSVANNLNDISKHHPDLVLDLCEKWANETKTTQWVAKHALRTLLKKGNQRAMKLFGFGAIQSIQVDTFKMAQSKIAIGDQTHLDIAITNKANASKFRLEYSIGYLKNNGSHNEKVFQLRETTIAKGETLTFQKKLDFKNLSTRKHYVGEHYIILKVNGNKKDRLAFELH